MAYTFVQAKHFTAGAIREVRALVVHMAEGGGTVSYLRNPTRKLPDGAIVEVNVSAHYVIEYSGRIVQMVRDGDASHTQHKSPEPYKSADFGIYSTSTAKQMLGDGWADPNRYIHSVEHEGFRATGPNAAQQASLIALVADLRARFPLRGLLGHRDIQDKPCPGGLIPWAALGGHGLFEGDDMKVTRNRWERWRAVNGNGVLRRNPVRSEAPFTRLPDGTEVSSFAEVTTPDGNNWRQVEFSGPAYLLRGDFDPVTPGGNPALDTAFAGFVATGTVTGDCTAEVDAATLPLRSEVQTLTLRVDEANKRLTSVKTIAEPV